MNLFCDNFFYNDLTEQIAKDIEICLAEGVKKKDFYRFWPYAAEILDDQRSVYVKWSVVRSDTMKQKWDLYGFAGPNESHEPSIEIMVLLKKGIWQKSTNIDGGALRNVIAHELHHLAQNIDTGPPKDPFDYFTSTHEAEAFRLGFRAQSHYSDISEHQLMIDYLKPRVECGELTDLQMNKIINVWNNVDWRLVNV